MSPEHIDRIYTILDTVRRDIGDVKTANAAQTEQLTSLNDKLGTIEQQNAIRNGRLGRLEVQFSNQRGWIAAAVVFIPLIVSVVVFAVREIL